MKKLILDSNILICLLMGKHSATAIENILKDRNIITVTCKELINEIINVASRDKIKKYSSEKRLNLLLKVLDKYGKEYILFDIPQRCRDKKDDYLLELAVVSNADYLITGDKDLLYLCKIGNCQIITLSEYLAAQ